MLVSLVSRFWKDLDILQQLNKIVMTSDWCGFIVGINHVSPIDEYPDEKWDVMISIMLTSPFDLIKYFIPSMKQKG